MKCNYFAFVFVLAQINNKQFLEFYNSKKTILHIQNGLGADIETWFRLVGAETIEDLDSYIIKLNSVPKENAGGDIYYVTTNISNLNRFMDYISFCLGKILQVDLAYEIFEAINV